MFCFDRFIHFHIAGHNKFSQINMCIHKSADGQNITGLETFVHVHK